MALQLVAIEHGEDGAIVDQGFSTMARAAEIWGLEWARRPTLVPALIISFVTLVAPFLVMQPAMGAGIAASKTPRPNMARLRSIATHTVYGIGLYISAWLRALVTS